MRIESKHSLRAVGLSYNRPAIMRRASIMKQSLVGLSRAGVIAVLVLLSLSGCDPTLEHLKAVVLSDRGGKDNPWIESFLVCTKEETLSIPWRSNRKRRKSCLTTNRPWSIRTVAENRVKTGCVPMA